MLIPINTQLDRRRQALFGLSGRKDGGNQPAVLERNWAEIEERRHFFSSVAMGL
jgi:hypothetical protein